MNSYMTKGCGCNSQIKLNFNDKIRVTVLENHYELKGLSFEESGHIGFASEKALNLLRTETVPKRLSLLQDLNLGEVDKEKCFVYVDNVVTNTSHKVALSKLGGGVNLKTVSEIPSDAQVGDYLFLEIKQ